MVFWFRGPPSFIEKKDYQLQIVNWEDYTMSFPMRPSIFNDVLGPVMRGPSSSHCAASLRIGRLCRDLMEGKLDRVLIEFDPGGSLATTHEAQGSDMGLFGGFLGWEADDARLQHSAEHLALAGIEVDFRLSDLEDKHPNTYQITLDHAGERRSLVAVSTGGGMIEVRSIDECKVSMDGGFYEYLIETKYPQKTKSFLELVADLGSVEWLVSSGRCKARVSRREEMDKGLLQELKTLKEVERIAVLRPVLPVLSTHDYKVPFTTCTQMMELNKREERSLWEWALEYECARGGMTKEEVFNLTRKTYQVMRQAVETGLEGTEYEDRILGSQSVKFREMFERGNLVGSGDINNRIVMYVSAIMEVKSSMGVIVAAPTAGSCGAMPGAVLAVADALETKEEEILKALLVAGLMGLFIAEQATFAAEIGGCQAECGAGATMAAAAIVYLAGGTPEQSIGAASMALQSSLGMICDPIGNRVEAPCLNRNVQAATNALSCANMALAGYNHLIPLDQVITTMYDVGQQMHHTLRCTNLGGLSITPAAKEIEERLGQKVFYKNC